MAYIILDKIEASQHVETIVAKKDLVNGQFVTLGKLAELDNGGEAHEVTEMVAGDTDIVLHASVPLVYDDLKGEVDFVLKAGKAGRGYRIKDGNTVSFSKDLITGTLAEEKYVSPQGTGLKIEETKPLTGLYGKVIEVYEDANVGQMAAVKFFK